MTDHTTPFAQDLPVVAAAYIRVLHHLRADVLVELTETRQKVAILPQLEAELKAIERIKAKDEADITDLDLEEVRDISERVKHLREATA